MFHNLCNVCKLHANLGGKQISTRITMKKRDTEIPLQLTHAFTYFTSTLVSQLGCYVIWTEIHRIFIHANFKLHTGFKDTSEFL